MFTFMPANSPFPLLFFEGLAIVEHPALNVIPRVIKHLCPTFLKYTHFGAKYRMAGVISYTGRPK